MSSAAETMPTPIGKTNDVLFDLWFPVDSLSIPHKALPEIKAILAAVKAEFLNQATRDSEGMVGKLLAGLTDPTLLPFHAALEASTDPAIVAFVRPDAGGIGGLDVETASAVLSQFFLGLPPGPAGSGQGETPAQQAAGQAATMTAMLCREIYLSTIWDLPLAVPLTGIQKPATFIDDTEIYANLNYPKLPESWLEYDGSTRTVRAKEGVIDYVVIGSGPAGATVASELRAGGKRVVLVEQGPFVVWGSMDTMSYSALMFQNNIAATADNAILVRSGRAMGGGSTVNIDLAFSPLESTIQYRISKWMKDGLIDGRFYTQERLSAAYSWVRRAIGTRAVSQSELNRDNRALWRGANNFGVNPDLYHLNRFQETLSPSPVTQKRDAARQLILPAIQQAENPLAVLPDVAVDELVFVPAPDGPAGEVLCTGARLTAQTPWAGKGNTIIDPCGLKIPAGEQFTILAENVVLSAGTIGSTEVLLKTAATEPAIVNPNVGRGLIMHPSVPLLGTFKQRINLLEGLDSATFLEAFGVEPGFIFETMSGLPAYGALVIPGSGEQVYKYISNFAHTAGFGVMLVDTPSPGNTVTLQDGQPVLTYALSEGDKERFAVGVGIGVTMMFEAGAQEVIVPTNENVLEQPDFDPMVGAVLTDPSQAELVRKNLKFVPNRTLITSAHLQATNKLGTSAATSVASPRQRVWNSVTKGEIPNLYLMDSSMFPTLVGANPMQSLYTFAKIFTERLLKGMDEPMPMPAVEAASDALARGPSPLPTMVAAE